jgi:hypothetical protein
VKTAKAVHQNEWQRKLVIRMSGSESCSSERVATKAVHQNEWQRKLFIRPSGSISCSSGLRKQQGLFTRTSISKQWQQGLSLYETPTAAAGAVRYKKHQPTAKIVDQRRQRKLSTSGDGGSCRPHKATGGGD